MAGRERDLTPLPGQTMSEDSKTKGLSGTQCCNNIQHFQISDEEQLLNQGGLKIHENKS